MKAVYKQSEKKYVQGKKRDVYRKYSKEWKITEQGGGNGNWLLTKPSDAVLNGDSVRNIILDYYHEERLTQKLVDKFNEDIENDIIKFAFSRI